MLKFKSFQNFQKFSMIATWKKHLLIVSGKKISMLLKNKLSNMDKITIKSYTLQEELLLKKTETMMITKFHQLSFQEEKLLVFKT